MCANIDKCLERLTLDDSYDLAVGVSRIQVMYTSFFRNHKLFCFDRSENIANYTISLVVRNDYGLMSAINEIMRRILEGGLNVKWERENEVKLPPEIRQNKRPGPVGMEEAMTLIYFVCIPGLFLTTATFSLERFIASQKLQAKTTTKKNFWTRLENLIDGQRHMFKLMEK